MKQVNFKQQDHILTGNVISESGDYLQVIVHNTEYIITIHQVVSTVIIPDKVISFDEIMQNLTKLIMENLGTNPSKQKLAASLGCTVDDIVGSLHKYNLTYRELFAQAPKQAHLNIMEGGLSLFKIKKTIEAIKSNCESINELHLSTKLQVTLEQLQNYCTTYEINLNKLLDKTEPAPPITTNPLPVLTADQVLWRGRIINITSHARERLTERFQITDINEILELALSEVCEVTKNKYARKKALKRHNGVMARYLVSYKHNLVMVFSKNLSAIITVYSTKDCLWLKNSLNTYEAINFSKNWS